ncbi:DNA polymerase III subunit delta [Bacteriophage Phi NF-1]|uniref:DNA polymerase III subunit delta n=1 Tax=Bacteriophage Phi NF-1 TaxID=2900273 RepID=A0A976QWZ6_9CAUD|nr:DNA polymerase III subunit delta [Bacteriophage Phi NF-1]
MKSKREEFKMALIMEMIVACDLSCSRREVKPLTPKECRELIGLLDGYLDRVTAARVGVG